MRLVGCAARKGNGLVKRTPILLSQDLGSSLITAEDDSDCGIIFRILRKDDGRSSGEEIVSRYRRYEKQTAGLLRSTPIRKAIADIVNALIKSNFSWASDFQNFCNSHVRFGAERKFQSTAGSEWLRGYFGFPHRLKKDDVLLVRTASNDNLRVFRVDESKSDPTNDNDLRSFKRGEVTGWLKEHGIKPIPLFSKGWKQTLIRIDDVPKRILFKLRFDL